MLLSVKAGFCRRPRQPRRRHLGSAAAPDFQKQLGDREGNGTQNQTGRAEHNQAADHRDEGEDRVEISLARHGEDYVAMSEFSGSRDELGDGIRDTRRKAPDQSRLRGAPCFRNTTTSRTVSLPEKCCSMSP